MEMYEDLPLLSVRAAGVGHATATVALERAIRRGSDDVD
jgi:hypothetical protein